MPGWTMLSTCASGPVCCIDAGNTKFAFATDVLNNGLFIIDVVAGTSQKVLQFEVSSASQRSPCVQGARPVWWRAQTGMCQAVRCCCVMPMRHYDSTAVALAGRDAPAPAGGGPQCGACHRHCALPVSAAWNPLLLKQRSSARCCEHPGLHTATGELTPEPCAGRRPAPASCCP
jgi:hypothetical protein